MTSQMFRDVPATVQKNLGDYVTFTLAEGQGTFRIGDKVKAFISRYRPGHRVLISYAIDDNGGKTLTFIKLDDNPPPTHAPEPAPAHAPVTAPAPDVEPERKTRMWSGETTLTIGVTVNLDNYENVRVEVHGAAADRSALIDYLDETLSCFGTTDATKEKIAAYRRRVFGV